MFGIIGSGFGLYGHLPAIAQLTSEPVMLPQRYIPVFEKRKELAIFSKQIVWVTNEEIILKEADTVTISVVPLTQEDWTAKCIECENIKHLVLEKPISATPQHSADLLSQLISSGKTFRINYAFMHTAWYKRLNAIANLNTIIAIKINWTFLAHHYAQQIDNWKRHRSSGGSVIRFFGIHLIAMLSNLNYSNINSSKTFGFSDEDVFKWDAEFKNETGSLLQLSVDSFSTEKIFDIQIEYVNKDVVQLEHICISDPFSEAPVSIGQDYRIDGLKTLYRSLFEIKENASCYDMYQSANIVWDIVEKVNIAKISQPVNI